MSHPEGVWGVAGEELAVGEHGGERPTDGLLLLLPTRGVRGVFGGAGVELLVVVALRVELVAGGPAVGADHDQRLVGVVQLRVHSS